MSEQALVRARTVHHIRIDSGRPYTQFRTDYETVVPSFDRLEAIGVVKSNAGWTAMPLRIVIAEGPAGSPELDPVSSEFTATLAGILSLPGLEVPLELVRAP